MQWAVSQGQPLWVVAALVSDVLQALSVDAITALAARNADNLKALHEVVQSILSQYPGALPVPVALMPCGGMVANRGPDVLPPRARVCACASVVCRLPPATPATHPCAGSHRIAAALVASQFAGMAPSADAMSKAGVPQPLVVRFQTLSNMGAAMTRVLVALADSTHFVAIPK